MFDEKLLISYIQTSYYAFLKMSNELITSFLQSFTSFIRYFTCFFWTFYKLFMKSYKLQIKSYKLRIKSYKLCIKSYKLLVSCELFTSFEVLQAFNKLFTVFFSWTFYKLMNFFTSFSRTIYKLLMNFLQAHCEAFSSL